MLFYLGNDRGVRPLFGMGHSSPKARLCVCIFYVSSLSISISTPFRYFDNDDMKSSKPHVVLLSLIFLLKRKVELF